MRFGVDRPGGTRFLLISGVFIISSNCASKPLIAGFFPSSKLQAGFNGVTDCGLFPMLVFPCGTLSVDSGGVSPGLDDVLAGGALLPLLPLP